MIYLRKLDEGSELTYFALTHALVSENDEPVFLAYSEQTGQILEGLFNKRVSGEVAEERLEQDSEWGGSTHDDKHDVADWLRFIEYQIAKIRQDGNRDRERLIKIAALAQAAVESLDRKNKEKS